MSTGDTLQPRLLRAILSLRVLPRPRARQLCRKDDRHLPGHPAIVAVLNDRHLVLPRAIYLSIYLSMCLCTGTGSPRSDSRHKCCLFWERKRTEFAAVLLQACVQIGLYCHDITLFLSNLGNSRLGNCIHHQGEHNRPIVAPLLRY